MFLEDTELTGKPSLWFLVLVETLSSSISSKFIFSLFDAMILILPRLLSKQHCKKPCSMVLHENLLTNDIFFKTRGYSFTYLMHFFNHLLLGLHLNISTYIGPCYQTFEKLINFPECFILSHITNQTTLIRTLIFSHKKIFKKF